MAQRNGKGVGGTGNDIWSNRDDNRLARQQIRLVLFTSGGVPSPRVVTPS